MLLFGCGLLYASFIKVGEDNVQLSEAVWVKNSVKYDTLKKGYICHDTSIYWYYKYSIDKYLYTQKSSIQLSFEYGGRPLNQDIHNIDTAGVYLRDTISMTWLSDTLIPRNPETYPNRYDKISNEDLDSISNHYKLARIDDENLFIKKTIKVSNSFTKKYSIIPEPVYDSSSKTSYSTITINNDADDIPMVTSYSSISIPYYDYRGRAPLYVPFSGTCRIPHFGEKPTFFRKEDLSRRIINIELEGAYAYKEIASLIMEFNGPINVVAADVFPDATTMTSIIYSNFNAIERVRNGKIRLYIEFPEQEHIQEARILLVTTFALSVLCTLIINCFFAIIKYANRNKKTNEMKNKSIPCYGSFSDCSECSMYETCSFRPMNRVYYRALRRMRNTVQEESKDMDN